MILRKASLTEDQWHSYMSEDFSTAAKEAYFGASAKPKEGRSDNAVKFSGSRTDKFMARSFSRDTEAGDSGQTVRRWTSSDLCYWPLHCTCAEGSVLKQCMCLHTRHACAESSPCLHYFAASVSTSYHSQFLV